MKEKVTCQQREQHDQCDTGLREGGTDGRAGALAGRDLGLGPWRPELVSVDLGTKLRSFSFLLETVGVWKV